MKKISICIPCFNAEKYIQQAIESALDQDYPNKEIIVVDNCSTDQTAQLISKYEECGIIHYKNNENIGLNANHNRCMELATGDYIHLLSADDYYISKNILSRVMKIVGENQDACVVGLCGGGQQTSDITGIYDGPTAIKKTFLGALLFRQVPSMILFSRKLIANGSHFNTTNELGYGDDSTFFFGLMLNAQYIYINFPAVYFRKHSESATEKLTKSGEAYFLHNKLLDGWIRKEKFIPLSKFEKMFIMGFDYFRVSREMPNCKEKQLLLDDGYRWPEIIIGIAFKLAFKLPKNVRTGIKKLVFKGR